MPPDQTSLPSFPPKVQPAKTTLQLIFSSRKAVYSAIVGVPILIAIVLLEIAVFVQMVRGRIEATPAITLMFGGIIGGALGVAPLAKSVVDGWSREDASKQASADVKKTDGAT